MTLFIACILIYQFNMPWGFYVIAVVLYLPSFFKTLGEWKEDARRKKSMEEGLRHTDWKNPKYWK